VSESTRLEEYAANLQEYLAGAGETALKRAYEMARQAMADGVGVLEMAALHHEAMALVMRGTFKTESGSWRILAAETVFVESMSPFEMTHRAFRESNATLRLLNERLEEEAKRIAHALHAEASQLLVSAHLALESVSRELPANVRHHLSKFENLLDQISEQIRRLSHELRPTMLEDLGLLPALRFLAEGVSARARIPVTVTGELETVTRPAPAVETAIYRAVQEALNNITKHARATEAVVDVLKDHGRIVCSVRDDGKGFDQAAELGGNGTGGIGLRGIRERLHVLRGTLQIHSTPGRGTDLIITVPMEG
jgi:two-component system sensor histidine kinase UhpB